MQICVVQAREGMVLVLHCQDPKDNLVLSFSKRDPEALDISAVLVDELSRMREDEAGEEIVIQEVNFNICVVACVCTQVRVKACKRFLWRSHL